MTRAKLLVAGLAAAAVTLSGCGFQGLYSANLPGGASLGAHPYSVNVYFTDVLDLVPQSAVKVNDVSVGKVTAIRLSRAGDDSGYPLTNGWTARVTVRVNGSVDLPGNARAAIKMTSLLGEKYVSLEQPTDPPSASRLHNDSTIPITRTGTAPEVEEVLGALSLLLNGGGLAQLKTITTELNKALNGNEGAVRDLLAQLNTFVGTLDKQKSEISTALDSIDKLAVTLNNQKQSIVRALDTFPRALEILKNERTQLVTALSSLSELGTVASRVVTETQQDLVTSLKSLQPVLTRLAATGQDLPDALKIMGTFPFPIGKTTEMVKGDYANLNLFLDLNLTNELCGLNAALCALGKVQAASSPQPERATSSAGHSLEPVLIGAGR
jgi:phospholipid/cholesterol/gamma-HCH transport system substrate-binding protein